MIAQSIAILVGYGYGVLLNKIKGSEMMISTYSGFSIVSLMCMAWRALPLRNQEIGAKNFVHYSFPRHMSNQAIAMRTGLMEKRSEELGMKFFRITAYYFIIRNETK